MINFLQGAPIEPQPGFMQQYSFIIMIGLMVLVLWLFMWRPEAKRRKQMQEFRNGLKKGDKIITAGGIYGVVKEIKETTLLIEVDGNVTLRIDKNMVVADNSDLQRQEESPTYYEELQCLAALFVSFVTRIAYDTENNPRLRGNLLAADRDRSGGRHRPQRRIHGRLSRQSAGHCGARAGNEGRGGRGPARRHRLPGPGHLVSRSAGKSAEKGFVNGSGTNFAAGRAF